MQHQRRTEECAPRQMPQKTIVNGTDRSSCAVSVLIADDHEPWRSMVRSFLERERQWQVFEACDGLEAVRKAAELHPDVVLLDVGMPGLNGIEAAQKIREVSPDSEIIFLSQQVDEEIVSAALRTGASAYVLKDKMAIGLLPAIRVSLQSTP